MSKFTDDDFKKKFEEHRKNRFIVEKNDDQAVNLHLLFNGILDVNDAKDTVSRAMDDSYIQGAEDGKQANLEMLQEHEEAYYEQLEQTTKLEAEVEKLRKSSTIVNVTNHRVLLSKFDGGMFGLKGMKRMGLAKALTYLPFNGSRTPLLKAVRRGNTYDIYEVNECHANGGWIDEVINEHGYFDLYTTEKFVKEFKRMYHAGELVSPNSKGFCIILSGHTAQYRRNLRGNLSKAEHLNNRLNK